MSSISTEVNQISIPVLHAPEFEKQLQENKIEYTYLFRFMHGYHAYQLNSNEDKASAFKIKKRLTGKA